MAISSISELKNIVPVPGDYKNVLGYYNSQDGGGGDFFWDSTFAEQDNQGTIIQSSKVTNGRWRRLFDKEINVKWFGAKGNDTGDDTPAIQRAVDFVKNQKGGVVYLPAGTYRITHIDLSSAFYSNIELIGQGRKVTIFKDITTLNPVTGSYARTGWADGMLLIMNRVADQPTDASAIKNIKVSKIGFYSDVEAKGFDELFHHICVYHGSHIIITECDFVGFLGDAISVTAGVRGEEPNSINQNISITNNTIDGVNKNNRQGISIYHCDNFEISNNDIRNTTRADMPGAIDIEPIPGSISCKGGVINNNRIFNCGGGVGAISVVFQLTNEPKSGSVTVSNNQILDSPQCNGITVIGDVLNLPTESNFGVRLENNYTSNVLRPFFLSYIAGVKVSGNRLDLAARSVKIEHSSDIWINNNIFMRNQDQIGCIELNEGCVDIHINENIFKNIKSVCIYDYQNGLRTFKRNRLINNLSTIKQPPVVLKYLRIPEQVTNDDWSVNHLSTDHFYSVINKYQAINGGSDFLLAVIPDKMPYGENTFSTGANGGYPRSGYTGNNTGLVKVIRSTDPNYPFVTQTYYPKDDGQPVFYRHSINGTSWGHWQLYQMIPA